MVGPASTIGAYSTHPPTWCSLHLEPQATARLLDLAGRVKASNEYVLGVGDTMALKVAASPELQPLTHTEHTHTLQCHC